MGLSLRLNRLLNQKKPENFSNLYIPGFNKVLEDDEFELHRLKEMLSMRKNVDDKKNFLVSIKLN